MIKILFFDIDGTLLELGQKEMHQELVDALNLVKEKGIKIFLATGRAPLVVPKFHGIEFDGVLSFNGSYCYTNNELIYKNPMDKTDIQTLVNNAKKLNKAVTLAGINKMGCNFDDEILEEYFMIANQHAHVIDEFNEFMKEEIYQMMVATTEDQDELILENTTTLKVARWWNKACDIIPCDGGKDICIQKILDYYNFKKDEAMAFGDGGNDISMLNYVGTGVAMGNATNNVKAIANYITDSVQEDGIVTALKHFEII